MVNAPVSDFQYDALIYGTIGNIHPPFETLYNFFIFLGKIMFGYYMNEDGIPPPSAFFFFFF